jgi:propionyl-CoA synthetase
MRRLSSFPFNRVKYLRDLKHARESPDAFWMEKSQNVAWFEKPHQALPSSSSSASWFPGGTLNNCYNAVDRHVHSRQGGNIGLIYESLVTGEERKVSFDELQKETSNLAKVLERFGVTKGDAVLLYMPQIPQAIVSMLACARIGAPHVVVFAGFAPKQLAARIEHVKPKVIISCNYLLEGDKVIDLTRLVRESLQLCHHQPKVLMYHREGHQNTDEFECYQTEVNRAASSSTQLFECVPLKSSDPLYYLHTSGTTGQPKALIRENGGHCVSLSSSVKEIMGIHRPGNVMWAASDIGWIVGHSFSVYAPLFAGASSLLIEGKPINSNGHLDFFRLLEKHKGIFLISAVLFFFFSIYL